MAKKQKKKKIINLNEEIWNKLQFSEFSQEKAEWNGKLLEKEIQKLLDQTRRKIELNQNGQEIPIQIKRPQNNDINFEDLLNAKDNAQESSKETVTYLKWIFFIYEEKIKINSFHSRIFLF